MTVSTPKITAIPLEDIADHPYNPRFDLGDLSDLEDSIRQHGVLQPITVVACDPDAAAKAGLKCGDKPWWLLMGHRRRAGADQADLQVIPAIVRTDLDTIPAQIEVMLEENDHREDLSPVEEAAAYEQLVMFGYDRDQIAKAVGKGKTLIGRRLALMQLSQTVRNRVHAHEITLADAESLAEFADTPEDLKRAEAAIGTWNFAHVVTDLQRQRAARVKRPKVLEGLRDKGIKVVKPPKNWEYEPTAKIRPVTQLAKPDGSAYSKPATEHRDCDGHVAVVDELAKVIYACNKPNLHPKSTRTTQHQPRDEADIKLEEALEVASVVRVEYMTGLVAGKATDDLQRAVLIGAIAPELATLYNLDDEDLPIACKLLGFDSLPDVDITDEVFSAYITEQTEKLHKLPVAKLVMMLGATTVLHKEYVGSWTEIWAFRRQDSRLVQYIDWLRELGYEPGDVERNLLGPADESAAS